MVAVHAASLVAYGRHAWMLGAVIAGRAVLISVADNSYHDGTELDAPLEAMNLRLPRVLEFTAVGRMRPVGPCRVPWLRLRDVHVALAGRVTGFDRVNGS